MDKENKRIKIKTGSKKKVMRDKTEVINKRVVKHRKCKEYGVTREEFHSLLQKASQPTSEAQSEQGKSET